MFELRYFVKSQQSIQSANNIMTEFFYNVSSSVSFLKSEESNMFYELLSRIMLQSNVSRKPQQ